LKIIWNKMKILINIDKSEWNIVKIVKNLKYTMKNMRKNRRKKYKITKSETLTYLNPYFGDTEEEKSWIWYDFCHFMIHL
jgi:hypothetical protein